MTLGVVCPSRNRPHLLGPLVESIRATTPADTKLLFSVCDDESFDTLQALWVPHIPGMMSDTATAKVNDLCSLLAPHVDYIVGASDDLIFSPGWFEAAEQMLRAFDVVGLNDLNGRDRGTHSIVRSSYLLDQPCIDTPGAVLYPGYWHNYAEIEMFETAQSRGAFAWCAGAIAEHRHWTMGKAPFDETYEFAGTHYEQDHALFLSRQPLWKDPENKGATT